MAFELFKKEYNLDNRRKAKPTLFINKHFLLEFHRGSQKLCGFIGGNFINLWYNRAEKIIGIELSEKNNQDAISVNKGNYISILAFLRYHKLDVNAISGLYLLEQHGALWVFDLKKRKEGRAIGKKKSKD